MENQTFNPSNSVVQDSPLQNLGQSVVNEFNDDEAAIHLNARLIEAADNNLIIMLCIGLLLGVVLFVYVFNLGNILRRVSPGQLSAAVYNSEVLYNQSQAKNLSVSKSSDLVKQYNPDNSGTNLNDISF